MARTRLPFLPSPPDYARFSSLPAWAQQTLASHASDRRDFLYSEEQFALSQTTTMFGMPHKRN